MRRLALIATNALTAVVTAAVTSIFWVSAHREGPIKPIG